jgi:hypothetical protein
MPTGTYTYFLAHAGADAQRAKELRNLLHPDVQVFLDSYDLVPGDQWDLELPRRQREALATVALVSAATDAAYYLREEIARAIAQQRQDPEAHRLIPVFLDGTPKIPPYGLQVRHSLDAAQLGMPGVAAELRRVAGLLKGEPVAPPLPEPAQPVDRMEVFDVLCKLLPSQFEEVVFRVAAPRQHMAPASEPPARRALDLVQWAELDGTGGLAALRTAIRKTAPAARGF